LPKCLKLAGAPLFARLPERLFGQAFLPYDFQSFEFYLALNSQ
jgi:hypothetical protein